MLDRILSALGKCGIEDYHIVVEDEQSAELFFIKKELDMQRLKKVQTADVSVYHVFEEGDNRFRGVASVQVQDSHCFCICPMGPRSCLRAGTGQPDAA